MTHTCNTCKKTFYYPATKTKTKYAGSAVDYTIESIVCPFCESADITASAEEDE